MVHSASLADKGQNHMSTVKVTGWVGWARFAGVILLVSGLWDRATAALRVWAAQFTTVL